MDENAPPKIIPYFNVIIPEPSISYQKTQLIKPIPINKSHSISPEPLFKRMRLI